MDLNTIINLIGSVGFPIAITLYLLLTNTKKEEKMNETLNNISLNLQENTIMIKQLIDIIKEHKNDKE